MSVNNPEESIEQASNHLAGMLREKASVAWSRLRCLRCVCSMPMLRDKCSASRSFRFKQYPFGGELRRQFKHWILLNDGNGIVSLSCWMHMRCQCDAAGEGGLSVEPFCRASAGSRQHVADANHGHGQVAATVTAH